MDVETRRLTVLGSTGSVGESCMDVVRRFPRHFHVVAMTAWRNVRFFAEQIAEFKPKIVVIRGPEEAKALRGLIDPGQEVEILEGQEGLIAAAALSDVDTVLSAVVGAAGLRPTWAAVAEGKRIALANKETLVMAGEMIMKEAEVHGAEILPVDSEHSAIFQALGGHNLSDVQRLILTASGGPFHGYSASELKKVTRDQALAHPNWSMGAKISIDSATLMNKGLEVIEARWLFGLPWEQIDILVHPQSIVHSLVEYVDGSVLAQLGIPDMRVPIAYALSYPNRLPLGLPSLDLPESRPLSFCQPDRRTFPCLALALEAGRKGGVAPAVLNAANEVAVQAFLDNEIKYIDIAAVVRAVLADFESVPARKLDDVLLADQRARVMAREVTAQIKGGGRK